MDNIKQKNTIVSHETIEPYYICWNNHGRDELRRIYADDDTGCIFLEVITPACNQYSPFESTCISECTWCDNPYHCKYKNVSRETYYTTHDILIYMVTRDICFNCFGGFCEICTHELSDMMLDLAMNMVIRGEY